MATSKPTIVLVPGAWHTPDGFDKLVVLLEAAGYATQGVNLPSIGVSPGLPDFSLDVTAIKAAVSSVIDGGKDVVVVLHSYGGIPGTEALQGLGKKERAGKGEKFGVARIVYIASFAIKAGESMITAIANHQSTEEEKNRGTYGHLVYNADNTVSMEQGESLFYHDLDTDTAQHYAKKLKTTSTGTFASELTYESYRDIPAAYLICKQDRALSPEKQRAFADAAGIELVEEIDTGHSPFLSKPELVEKFIRRAAGESL